MLSSSRFEPFSAKCDDIRIKGVVGRKGKIAPKIPKPKKPNDIKMYINFIEFFNFVTHL